ncbi:MAG: hypothetical protein ACI93T_001296 [Porticoccaceae bacterium]
MNDHWEVRQRKTEQFSQGRATEGVVTNILLLQPVQSNGQRNAIVAGEGSSAQHRQHKSFQIARVVKKRSQSERSDTAVCVATGLTILRRQATQKSQPAILIQPVRPA